ncbi:carboxypeptidase-like regulatory domain-containing protein [Natrinema caseinilyticum]|uniref:carboxypeptidase-like regulatory domain-containing protein n=1 Tax=Natrinema caseinilyticum TaxID=2961570 RepID=UPI0020C30D85|nr:carboxypeptidase-like regulatory domain-containing protein [Natrinema caseinilyticum]
MEIGTVTDHTGERVAIYPPADGEITVTEGGDSVESASVTFTKRGDDRAAATGTTDGDGVFAVTGLETGYYDVVVRKPGFYEESTTVDLETADGTTIDIDPGTAEVTFTVTDGYLDQSLEVDVTILKDGERDSTVSTNQNGQRSIDLAVNTEYSVRIEREGYGEHERKLTVNETDTSRTYQIERTPSLSLEVTNDRIILGETVGVTVTDEYGDPVDGTSVRIDGTDVATTDAAGMAAVPIEAAGSLDLTAAVDGTTSNAVTVEGVDADGTGDDGEEIENTSTGSEEPASEDGVPGFGAPAALVAGAALVGGLAVRRRG